MRFAIVPRLIRVWMSIITLSIVSTIRYRESPIRRALETGVRIGIRSDDIVAGAYAAVGTALVVAMLF